MIQLAEQKQPSSHKEEAIKRVCFVCTGNTCRSPMAAAVANHLAKQFSDNDSCPKIEAFSAGLYAVEGEPIAQNAVLALEGQEIQVASAFDFHTHRAHTLQESEAEAFDLLIGLGDRHMMELLLRFPHLAQKIIAMPHAIFDPYGGDQKLYEVCLQQIIEGVKELLFLEDAE